MRLILWPSTPLRPRVVSSNGMLIGIFLEAITLGGIATYPERRTLSGVEGYDQSTNQPLHLTKCSLQKINHIHLSNIDVLDFSNVPADPVAEVEEVQSTLELRGSFGVDLGIVG